MSAASSIDLDSDPRSIIGSRIYEAPRDLVDAARTIKHNAETRIGETDRD